MFLTCVVLTEIGAVGYRRHRRAVERVWPPRASQSVSEKEASQIWRIRYHVNVFTHNSLSCGESLKALANGLWSIFS